MNIEINEITAQESERIEIYCYPQNKPRMASVARSFDISCKYVLGKSDGNTYKIVLSDIYYFETVEEKLFIYCEHNVYENRMRLYEVEEIGQADFFKASKSTLVNVDKIDHMKPSFSGRFELTLLNGEKLMVSRKYVSELKKRMGLS